MKKKKSVAYIGKVVLWLAVMGLVFAFFFIGLNNVTEEVSEQGRTKLEDAVRRVFGRKGEAIVEANIKALALGRAAQK